MQFKRALAFFKGAGSKAANVILGCLLFFIEVYRWLIRPYLPNSCRFTPSCSQYATMCLKQQGLIRGVPLVVWRILRCQPFAKGGVDPVPPLAKGCEKSIQG